MGSSCGQVNKVYSTSTVQASGNYVGGFAGWFCQVNSLSSDIYATGDVTGYDYVGGLLGQNRKDGSPNCTISNAYSTGVVTALQIVSPKKGGLVGYQKDYANMLNSFWDTETSGLSTTAGSGATGKTTAQMQTESTFTGAGWDFTSGTGIWEMPDGGGYPVFQ